MPNGMVAISRSSPDPESFQGPRYPFPAFRASVVQGERSTFLVTGGLEMTNCMCGHEEVICETIQMHTGHYNFNNDFFKQIICNLQIYRFGMREAGERGPMSWWWEESLVKFKGSRGGHVALKPARDAKCPGKKTSTNVEAFLTESLLRSRSFEDRGSRRRCPEHLRR